MGKGWPHPTSNPGSISTLGCSHASPRTGVVRPTPLRRRKPLSLAAGESRAPSASTAVSRPQGSGWSHIQYRQVVPAGEMPENRSCPAEPHDVAAIRRMAKQRPGHMSDLKALGDIRALNKYPIN
ncbi:hypothetical protein NDU88_002653 [Pleurodeles waltl]|uniref:Uncharacterized protein n=1 Tax=Pleurodeles waltl TaxID=8319 RepID=A0AAV7W2R8_PLEWA|nr:hypothetical protein NDU88_002653 [Pleurodeles waltl]